MTASRVIKIDAAVDFQSPVLFVLQSPVMELGDFIDHSRLK